MRTRWLALGLALLVLIIHYRWLLEGGLIGAPQSDVIRGVWGMDQQVRGLPLPFWTSHIGFPEGVKIVILPWFSSLLATPLIWSLSPVLAYDLWILGLLWATGFCSALLARALSGSDTAGWLVGVLMISQPMIWLAITDGTPENVAFWAVPAFLAALHHAQASGSRNWGMAAGGLAVLVALDSPYHAIFSLPLALPILFGGQSLWMMRGRAWLGTLAVIIPGALILYGLYWGLSVSAAPPTELGNNAVHLRNWLQWEAGQTQSPWDWTFAPCFIPSATLILTGGLALLSPRRALPWLGMGLICLGLSLGPAAENPPILGEIAGPWAKDLGEWVQAMHQAHPLPVVRFLRRWLVPAALCFGLAGELGLAALLDVLRHWFFIKPQEGLGRLFVVPGPLLAAWALSIVWQQTAYPSMLPLQAPILPEALQFVADYPMRGAMVLLPSHRGAYRRHERNELPVFANLGASLSSASELWLQTLSGRAAVNSPTGLITMVPRHARAEATSILLRDLDDLTVPQVMGTPLPPSATMAPDVRAASARALVEQGLRFIVVDTEIYGEEGLKLLKLPFADLLKEEKSFADGSGILVLVVAP